MIASLTDAMIVIREDEDRIKRLEQRIAELESINDGLVDTFEDAASSMRRVLVGIQKIIKDNQESDSG